MLVTIPAQAAQAECTRDSECKGTRICEAYYDYDGNKPDHHFDYPGIAAEIVGGVATLSGIALVTAGLYRWSSWLPPRTLDSAPASEVQSMRVSASKPEKAATRWVVLPSLGSQQAGLCLAATF
jgi:hypothetical protein